MLKIEDTTSSSKWSPWDYGKVFLATVGAVAAGAVGWSLLSNLWGVDGDSNQLAELISGSSNKDYSINAVIPPDTTDNTSTDVTFHTDSHANPAGRRLLSTISVVHPMESPKIIDASKEWTYPLNDVFSGDVQGIGMDTSDNDPPPTWLMLDPTVGKYAIPNALGVKVIDNTAYISDGDGFKTLNVSDSKNPSLLSRFDMPFGAGGVIEISNGRAYLSAPLSKTYIFDVRNPTNVTLLGVCDAQSVFDLKVVNQIGYVAAGFSGFSTVNYTDPANCVELDNYHIGLDVTLSVYYRNGIAYTTNSGAGLSALNVTDLTDITALSSVAISDGGADKIEVIGNTAYLVGSAGVLTYNVTNPSALALMGSYIVPDIYLADICVQGNFAYAISSLGVEVIDLSNPFNPIQFNYIDILYQSINMDLMRMQAIFISPMVRLV